MKNYETFVELKKCGFPFIEIKAGDYVGEREYLDFNPGGNPEVGAQHYFIPTLSEVTLYLFNRISDSEREVTSLRNDFQNLNELFHTTRQILEAEIESLMDELKKYVPNISSQENRNG